MSVEQAVKALYQPSKWQQSYHALTHEEALGAGAAGPGKTRTLIMDPFQQILVEHERAFNKKHAHHHGPGESRGWALHLRRTFPMLEQTIVNAGKVIAKVDPGGKWNPQKSTWTLSSGFRYQFGHCKDPNDWEMYFSNEYCSVRGTRIAMGDGSLMPIEEIRAGDSVMTLEGPKRVLATWRTGFKPCVEVDVRVQGEKIGTFLQPTTHPVLIQTSDESQPERSPGSPQTEERCRPHGYVWQDYESLLCGRQESPETRVSIIDEETGYAEFGGSRQEARQLPELTARVALHEPTVRRCLENRRSPTESRSAQSLNEPSAVRPPRLSRPELVTWLDLRTGAAIGRSARGHDGGILACGAEGEPSYPGTPTGSRGGCSFSPHPGDEPPPSPIGTGRHSAPPQGDAEARIRAASHEGGPGNTPSGTHGTGKFYPHFYSRENRTRSEDTRTGTIDLRFAGWAESFDLTVEDANHYVNEFGIISIQTYIGFDELVQFEEEQYEQIQSRCRTADPVLRQMLKVRSMSNPTVTREGMENVRLRDPLWVRKRFVDPWPAGKKTLVRKLTLKSGEEVRLTRIYLPAKLSDNPDPDFVRTYETRLQGMKEHQKQALLEGNWYATFGAFFEDWNNDVHICKPFQIPRDWLRFRSMDWGYKSPGVCHWWAMDFDGNIFCEHEFTFKGMTATQVGERIRDREINAKLYKGKRSLITGPADTQIWEQRGSSAMSIAEEMNRVGVGWLKADKTSRARNANLLLKRLREHENGTKAPGIVFFENAKKAIQTIPSIMSDPNDAEVPQDGGDDHWLDSALYACAFASRGRLGIPSHRHADEKDPDEEPADDSRGNLGYGDTF